jgi:hypothetical protein
MWAVLAGGPLHAAPACTPPQAAAERWMAADCLACWQSADSARPGDFVLDWIYPSTTPDAPMSQAALREAGDRLRDASIPSPATPRTLVATHTVVGSMGVEVLSGPAWNGYFGLQMEARRKGRADAAGAVGWLALVEQLPAGEEGSPVARQLVRALAGPLPLQLLQSQPRVQHLRAVRIPQGVKPERLKAVAWVEDSSGRWLGVATEGCPAR